MAKLNGVKVIDAVNGEVTKIEYEGAEYAKVYGEAEVGDIAVLFDGHSVVGGDVGEFYPVVEGCKEPKIPTEYGGRINYVISKGYGAAFRKVSAPSLEDRVTALEGAVFAKKEPAVPALKVGDYAKVVAEYSDLHGKIVEVRKEDAIAFDFRCYLLDESANELFNVADLTPATDEEVAEAKRKASPDLPKGTKVRGKSTGSIRTLTERFPEKDSRGCGKAYRYKGCSEDWIGDQQFEIVTDEEIAAHEHAKLFTDVGRKVGEIRKGDIVRTLKEECGHPVGTVGIAHGDGSDESVRVEANGDTYRHVVKIVTFVENRLDRSASE